MKVAVTILAFCVTSLVALGLVMLYSSSMVKDGVQMLEKQVVCCVLGFCVCVTMVVMDYALLKKFTWPILIGSLFLAALVFVPHIGHASHGASRWIQFRSIQVQPSEIVKIGLIIALAWYGDRYQRKMNTFYRGVILPGLVIAAVIGLIFIEPDRGTSILLAAVSGTMLVLAGVKYWHLILPVLLAGSGLAYSLMHDSMRSTRISAWLHPEAHASGVAMQAEQAKIAIGSGGLTGIGLGDGRQKLGFISEIHCDFIFANIGEELGLVATALVVLAYFLIAVCGIFIALRARDRFGSLLAFGVTSLISYQAIINIGVVTSVLPNKGLALPFISYGGSSLVSMLIGVGILLSVARRAAPVKISAPDFVPDDNPFAAKAT